ncbi:YhcB family protein [Marinobacterium marinum]|uniref:Z-ring associated protein G n=1 Tax=Marinobacterium marinum TaxID=2756129 RepID=A0A7W1WZI2_9GAMM|nr:DUF1043 family protein [Marinobacterium marinum]MBA4503105.1 YhcB family protein [Marinobacterium marinum]
MEQTNIWIVTLVALGIGALIGFLLGRAGNRGGRDQELIDELDNTRSELESYKRKVSDHFEQTAELVNGLTDQYRKVHQHLAGSAENLCPGLPASAALQHELRPSLSSETRDVDNAEVDTTQSEQPEPPRDYAPKKPNEAGTLSEEYGFDRKDEEETVTRPAGAGDATAYGEDDPSETLNKKA